MFSTTVKRKKPKTYSLSRGDLKAQKKAAKAKDRRFNKRMTKNGD